MLIEAVKEPVTYRWPTGNIRLEPGCPVNLSEERALKLLAKAKGKVRVVGPVNWLSLWRVVAKVSDGLTPEDPRLAPVLRVIEGLDQAFAADDFPAFERGMADLREAMKNWEKA